MSRDQATALVVRVLGEIAPDTDPSRLEQHDDLQQTLDLDSMDVVNLVAAVSEETGREIADRDARRLRTLDDWSSYLADP